MSKVTPYPLRIAKCTKTARCNPANRKPIKEETKRVLRKGARGDGFPMTVAVTLTLVLLFCCIGEYFRISTIAQGVRDAVQQAVIATVSDNYDNVYHAVREGYAAGWSPTDDDWEESIDLGNIYANLAATLGLVSDGEGYVKYTGEDVEFTLSDLSVEIRNNGLGSGERNGYTATATVHLEVPATFAGSILPPVPIDLKIQARYIPKF